MTRRLIVIPAIIFSILVVTQPKIALAEQDKALVIYTFEKGEQETEQPKAVDCLVTGADRLNCSFRQTTKVENAASPEIVEIFDREDTFDQDNRNVDLAAKYSLVNEIAVWTGISLVSMGILLILPENITLWDHDNMGWSKFKEAYTMPPVWENDKWAINYVGHPLNGMLFYLSERNYDKSVLRSFLFSTALSILWEYGIEAWAERPSAQDLIFTSTIGSLMGEASYQATKLMRRNGFSTTEKIFVTIINPVYVIEHGFR